MFCPGYGVWRLVHRQWSPIAPSMGAGDEGPARQKPGGFIEDTLMK
jgi:hypothetical protein